MKKKIFAAICSVTMLAGAAASVPALDVFNTSDAIVAEAYSGYYNGCHWEYVQDITGYRITRCRNYNHLENITIPSTIGGQPVIALDHDAFVVGGDSQCEYVKNVTMPNTIYQIGNNFFKGCDKLESVTLSNTLITIGNYAFYNARALKNINVPNSVRQIGTDFCGQTPSLTSANLGNGVQIIGNYAFWYSTALQTMTIPNSVTTIDHHFCTNATGLRNVNIGTGLRTMGNYSFYNCNNIQNLNCNSTKIENLGAYTLNKYRANQTVILGGNYLLRYKGTASTYDNTAIKAVGPYAFKDASSTTKVYLEYCKYMNSNAFYGRSNTTVYLSAGAMYGTYGSNYASIVSSRVSPATVVWHH